MSVPLAAVAETAPESDCRSSLRQLLELIDETGPITREQLTRVLETTTCACPGHRLSFAGVHAYLARATDGRLKLSDSGLEWLLASSAAPSPDWQAAARVMDLPPLRKWQDEALRVWAEHGRRGVIEAVTGTGKSRVGLEAAREAIRDDFNVLVVVPTVDLVEQWTRSLRRGGISSVGQRGDSHRDSFTTHDVLVSTVQTLYRNPPQRHDGKVLIIADECHRYGSEEWRHGLSPTYLRRLGLTATFERTDDGLDLLRRYFGGTPVYSIGFRRAIDDGVVAAYDVSLLGVDLSRSERKAYDEAHETVLEARMTLVQHGLPEEPFGEFMREVQKAAEGDEDYLIEETARQYLKAFSQRIDIVASARAKNDAVPLLTPRVQHARGTLVFTRRVEAAEGISSMFARKGLDLPAVHSELSRGERRDRLSRLRARTVDGLVAPTVLDEGIDVPEVDLGIVMSGSKSRRQMIQRMGRVLRLKKDKRNAHFVIVYARDTIEDVSKDSGTESSLDLILETASSVTELCIERGVLQAVDSTEEVPAVGPHDVALPGMPEQVAALVVDSETLPMTRRALDEYKKAHGVDDNDAERDLRELLGDFLGLTEPTPVQWAAGGYRLEHEGFQVVVTPDRFVCYASRRKDANTWPDIRDRRENPDPSSREELSPAQPPTLLEDESRTDDEAFEEASTVEAPIVEDEMQESTGSALLNENAVAPQRAHAHTHAQTLVDQLERLAALFTSGALTADEFTEAKAQVLKTQR